MTRLGDHLGDEDGTCALYSVPFLAPSPPLPLPALELYAVAANCAKCPELSLAPSIKDGEECSETRRELRFFRHFPGRQRGEGEGGKEGRNAGFSRGARAGRHARGETGGGGRRARVGIFRRN
jgi:hypothetical protein